MTLQQKSKLISILITLASLGISAILYFIFHIFFLFVIFIPPVIYFFLKQRSAHDEQEKISN